MNLLKKKNPKSVLSIIGLFSIGGLMAVTTACLSISTPILLALTCGGAVILVCFAWTMFFLELTSNLRKKYIVQKQTEQLLSNLVWEANFIEQGINSLVSEHQKHLNQKDSEVKQLDIFINTTLYIRQILKTDKVLRTTVEKIQEIFNVERVVICRFNSDCSGTILTDFSVEGYQQINSRHINDLCFGTYQRQKYRDGYVSAIEDIYQASLTDCYINYLESFKVRATLVAPILQDKFLFGLLIAHQCEKPRVWEKWEVNLFRQLAIQVGIALDLADQYEQAVQARLETESLLEAKKEIIEQERKTKNNHAYLYSLDLSGQIKTLIQEIIDSNTQMSELNKTIIDIAATSYKALEKISKNIEALSSLITSLQKIKILNQGGEEISESVSSINRNVTQISALALNLGLNKSGENTTSFTLITQKIGKNSAELSQMSQNLQQILKSFEIQNSEVGDVEKTIFQLLEDTETIKRIIINLTKITSVCSKNGETLQFQKEALLSVDLLSQEIFQEFQVEQHTGLSLN